ncbi:HD-GYP domain-containing protein [Tunturiibacter psychrotolerans]|uniref:HD-GYP domain-containing protein n=1 Tax=Tunturiibacter psychrotolerans TaxID=3069686 RepID=UPI003D1FA4B5
MTDHSLLPIRSLETLDVDDFYTSPISTLIPALTSAFDLRGIRRRGHSLRTCAIGMQLAAKIGLADDDLQNLYYALLFASDCTLIHLNRTNGFRYELATRFVQYFALSPEIACLICATPHCRGENEGMQGFRKNRPVLALIISVAIALASGVDQCVYAAAINTLLHRPETSIVSDTVLELSSSESPMVVWDELTSSELLSHVIALEPRRSNFSDRRLTIDGICLAFALIADSNSAGFIAHSVGVARVAVSIAKLMGLDRKNIKLLQRAALVHDIGKIGVRYAVLEKSEALTLDEWRDIHRHPGYTKKILDMIPGFDEISAIAVAHHEKLDGSGYPCGLNASELPLPARILTVADIYDALSSQRPYRRPLGREEALAIMNREAPRALDQGCLDALAMATSHGS